MLRAMRINPDARERGLSCTVGFVSIHNADVAEAFDEIGDLLSIQGENAFRIRAYRRAAQIVRSLPTEVAEMAGTDEWRGPCGRPAAAGRARRMCSTRVR